MGKIEAIGVLAFGLMLSVGLASIFPLPSWWVELHSLRIKDATVGGPVPIDYDRAIHRDFSGEWQVQVWRAVRGEWSSYCATPPLRQDYEAAAVLPDDVDLEWLAYTQPRCYRLPPGVYKVGVAIAINPASRIRRRDVSIVSNAFRVSGE